MWSVSFRQYYTKFSHESSVSVIYRLEFDKQSRSHYPMRSRARDTGQCCLFLATVTAIVTHEILIVAKTLKMSLLSLTGNLDCTDDYYRYPT